MNDKDSFKKTWGPQPTSKSKKKSTRTPSPMSGTSLQDMKTNTLSGDGGWSNKGVKATKGIKIKKNKKDDKIFKGLGF